MPTTVIQTRLAVARFGDQTHFTGLARSIIYRWFTDPNERTSARGVKRPPGP